MSESGPKQTQPTPEERNQNRLASADVDPTRYSQLPPEELHTANNFTTYKSREMQTDGISEYVPLVPPNSRDLPDPNFATRQQVVSRIVKGIINVADVVRGPDGQYYSKKLSHESIEHAATHEEIYADLHLLALVFGDTDHKFFSSNGMVDAEHQNVLVDDGKVSYFDFGQADMGRWSNRFSNSPWSGQTGILLLRKLESLKNQLNGPEGLRFLEAIIEDTGTPANQIFPSVGLTDDTHSLQERLLDSIEKAHSLVVKLQNLEAR